MLLPFRMPKSVLSDIAYNITANPTKPVIPQLLATGVNQTETHVGSKIYFNFYDHKTCYASSLAQLAVQGRLMFRKCNSLLQKCFTSPNGIILCMFNM